MASSPACRSSTTSHCAGQTRHTAPVGQRSYPQKHRHGEEAARLSKSPYRREQNGSFLPSVCREARREARRRLGYRTDVRCGTGRGEGDVRGGTGTECWQPALRGDQTVGRDTTQATAGTRAGTGRPPLARPFGAAVLIAPRRCGVEWIPWRNRAVFCYLNNYVRLN